MKELTERLFRYVTIDTQSALGTGKHPSTEKQKDLGRLLVKELQEMGIETAEMDEFGNVYASISASEGVSAKVPKIGFTAHMDTAYEVCGTNIKPRLIENYDGEDIVLNKEKNIVFRVADYPHIKTYKGKDIIVSDGTTILGSDDKSGVSEIMELANTLMKDKSLKHGEIRICFACDEEIGESTKNLDLKKFDPDIAYSLDGGEEGECYFDNFNRANAEVTIHGKVAHTGYAKGLLVSACLLAHEFQAMQDPLQIPANTEGREGYVHLKSLTADIGTAKLYYSINDHEMSLFKKKKDRLMKIAEFMNDKYGEGTVEVSMTDNMYNMRDKIMEKPFIIDGLVAAMKEVGVEPQLIPVRGGVDGAEITQMGIPCPNLFTGGDRCHSIYEYCCVQSMEKAYQLILALVLNCCKSYQDQA